MSSVLPVNVLRYGRTEPLPNMIPLRAGPLSLLFMDGDLRAIKLGDHEIVQRIYVAVRDHNWGTVPAVIADLVIDRQTDSFRITYTATHDQDGITFVWHATITGRADGMITFAMNGAARSTFARNRIGICVLHGSDAVAGRSCVVEHTNGTLEHDTFPTFIAPHQPFFDIQAMTHEVVSGIQATLRFAGDVWEMEDQRNWTDASFKTYCTPLSVPFPVTITAGTTIQQAVTLTLHGTYNPAITVVGDTAEPITVELDPRPTGQVVSDLGLGMASHDSPLTNQEIRHLRALNLAHLRADLDPAQPDAAATLQRATKESATLGIPLELALHVSDADDWAALERMLHKYQPQIARWLVFDRADTMTDAAAIAALTPTLHRYAPSAPICGGTNANFAELNRHRPATDALNCISYSINPQVHAFDNLSLVENLSAQADTVASVRRFANGLPIVISPVTLRPRFNVVATGAESTTVDTLPSSVDPRQSSLFTAAWTLGSLKYLSESGVVSATYYETTRWRGIMETERESPLPTHFHSLPGTLFPVYHVFAALSAFAGGKVLPLRSSSPLHCVGFALRKNDQTRVLLANLSAEAQRLHLVGLQPALTVAVLDDTNVEHAMYAPDIWHAIGEQRRTYHSTLNLTLRPFALVVIDQPT